MFRNLKKKIILPKRGDFGLGLSVMDMPMVKIVTCMRGKGEGIKKSYK